MHLWGVLYTESMAESRQISDGLLAGLHDPAVRREAFDAVVGAWLRPLYWHVRRLVVVHEDAEDVVQESFVKAYDALDSFRGGRPSCGSGSTALPPVRPFRCCAVGGAASSPRSTM